MKRYKLVSIKDNEVLIRYTINRGLDEFIARATELTDFVQAPPLDSDKIKKQWIDADIEDSIYTALLETPQYVQSTYEILTSPFSKKDYLSGKYLKYLAQYKIKQLKEVSKGFLKWLK